LGELEIKGDAVEDLASRLEKIVPFIHDEISENVKQWVDGGLLNYDLKGQHLVWSWA
jgi:hypothetical protein